MNVLVVIVPCYNEEARLPRQMLLEWAERRPDWVWVLVDDGSRDGTCQMLAEFTKLCPNLMMLPLPHNVGKAEAVRQGLLWAYQNAPSPWYSYLDADLATPIAELARIHELYSQTERLLILGCRLQRLGAKITRSPLRHYLGRAGATLISLLLGLPTYDTQCGAKMVHRSLLEIGFGEPFLSRWLFDVELIARCRNSLGQARIRELAVEEPLLEWNDFEGSKLRARDFLRAPAELWRIHRRYNS